jgi:hypothetical protein
MRECCANCDSTPDEEDTPTKIEEERVLESDAETRTFAKAVYILLLLELSQEGEAFRCTSIQRQKLYMETIEWNASARLNAARAVVGKLAAEKLPAAAWPGRIAKAGRASAAAVDAVRAAGAEEAAAVAAVGAAAAAVAAYANSEKDVAKNARVLLGFNSFNAGCLLTPKGWLDEIWMGFTFIRRFEDAAVSTLQPHLNGQDDHVLKQASCGLGALARAGADPAGLAELEARIRTSSAPATASHRSLCSFCDLMNADLTYSAACKGIRCHGSGAEALGLDQPVKSGSTLRFARGLFVYVVADLSSRFDPTRAVRGSFGTASFAAQRVALGSLAAYLHPSEVLAAERHIEKWERAAGELIKGVLVYNRHGDVQLSTPREWVGAIKGLLSKFNECEAGLLSLINAGLSSHRTCLPVSGTCEPPCRAVDRHKRGTKCVYDRHFQADARGSSGPRGIWNRAGCGLAGLVKPPPNGAAFV